MSRGLKIKEIEEFPRRIKVLFGVLFSLLLVGTIGFNIIDRRGFEISFLRTLQTLVFIFEGSPIMSERILEIFIALIGAFLVWWVLWSLADMLLDGNLRKYLKSRFYEIKISKMENHIIIAGGGRVGEEVARRLTEKKEKFIITEKEPKVVEGLRKRGYLVIEGSAEQDNILIDAEIAKAKKIIITIPRTETNILITMSAKELNPNIEINARAEHSKFISKLKKAGAKLVIVPEVVAGDKFVE